MAPLTFAHNRRKFVSRDQAVQEVVNRNERALRSPSNVEAEATDRLVSALIKAKSANTESRVVKIVELVKDLDIVFSGRVLWGHIQVSWGGPATFRWGAGQLTLGFTRYINSGPGHCEIRLNREYILNKRNKWRSFKQAWGTLLHEMSHALTLVRCARHQSIAHNAHFRTTLHAVHRRSMAGFEMPAIDSFEDEYKQNHFMSDHWASDDPGGDSDVHTTSIVGYNSSDDPPTNNELRYTSHRGRDSNFNAGAETSYSDRDRSQDRHVQFAHCTKKHDADSRPQRKKHSNKKHSKTRDNGYIKYDHTASAIGAKYPNGALVQRRGLTTCAVM